MEQHFKRLVLLALTTLLALIAGFVSFPPDQAQFVVSRLGPWLMLATFGAFVASLYRLRFIDPFLHAPRCFLRSYWPEIAAIALCGTLLQVHEPHGFKVLADEIVLADTARSLHYEREFFTPVRAHNVAGNLAEMGGFVDKRPFFFAFVVSLIHDLTGYRPSNVFVVNGVATFVLLSLAAAFGRQLGGRTGGLLAVVLLSSIPLVAQNATGGGFELFNLMMIAAVMLLARRYLVKRDDASLNVLIFAAVLLAQTRYESVLFVLAVGAIVLGVWIVQREVRPTWPVILAPLMLVMYPLQNKVFQRNPDFWQLPEGVDKPFAAGFVFDNIGHAVTFFFDPSGNLPNSGVVAGAGIIAVVFIYVLVLSSRGRSLRSRPEVVVLVAFGLVILANFSLLMAYHWGQLNQFEVSRLSLPLYLLMVFAIVLVLHALARQAVVPRVACFLAGLLLYGHALPVTAKAASTLTALSRNEVAWQIEFLNAHRGEDMLYVGYSAILPIIYNVSGINLASANLHPENIDFHMRMKTYPAIYTFQRFDVKPDTGQIVPAEGFELSDAFQVEVIAERSFTPYSLGRISRIVGVHLPDEISAEPPVETSPGSSTSTVKSLTPAQAMAATQDADAERQREIEALEKDPMYKFFLRLP
ncbi:MAG: hypothetical protein D6820_13150 [Lentisphaerae bacterium]|nr:MAG: hypothetical protein D6820_13150 [Lentisphaerota bacterium]